MPSTRNIKDAVVRLQKAWAYLEQQYPILFPNDPKPFLIEVFRPAAVQRAYYAQGREKLAIVNSLRRGAELAAISEAENRRIITKSKPGTSKHERWPSQAFDIAFLTPDKKSLDYTPRLFNQAAVILRAEFPDVRWGGDFNGNGKADDSFVDRPHFEV
ncbi:hypothetical protein ACO2Q8_07775 [Larkinella sp. VNQ87]|uniref:hypothetical protein n=1 Tax=Larkinella sp. VNQ87 TaxID=3400921 RepID=UPI003C0F923F